MLRRVTIGALLVLAIGVFGATIHGRVDADDVDARVARTLLTTGATYGASASLQQTSPGTPRQPTGNRANRPKRKLKAKRQRATSGEQAAIAPASQQALTQELRSEARSAPAELADPSQIVTNEALSLETACVDDGPANGDFMVRLCITAPQDPTVTGDATVSAIVEVLSGSNPRVQRMVFYLDGEPLLTDYATPYEFELPSAKWADGSYLLEVENLTRYRDPVTLEPFTTARASTRLDFVNGNAEPPANTDVFTPTQGRPAGPGEQFLVVATGDGASGEPAADAVADAINSWSPNLFLYLGDVYDDGRTAEFHNWYGTDTRWGQFRDVTNPTIGNHEYEPDAAPYFDYWNNVPHFYSFDTQGWHFVAIDSTSNFGQEDPGSPQYEWLKADLAANTATCTVAYLHHPRYSIGTQGDRDDIDAIWRLLTNSGVDVVLTGHDHNYQRWVPLNAEGAPDADGATQFVIGSGGHGIRPFDPARVGDPRVAAASDASDARGALQLRLGPAGADYAYVSSSGATLDEGSLSCSTPVVPEGARGQLQLVAAQLAGQLPTGHNSTDDKIEKALEHLDKATADRQWSGDNQPLDDDGKVLDEMKKAAGELEDISSPTSEVTAALGSLQAIGRDLTNEAIAAAEAATGSLGTLGNAYEELAKADQHAAAAELEKELDKLKKAFKEARSSLADSPDPWTSGVGMRGRIGDALVGLRSSYPTGTSTDDRIERADQKLAEALALKRWSDDVRPSEDKGDEVIDRLKAALKEIEDAKPRTVQLQTSLDEIATISRDLARTAIDEAIAGGGKASDVQKAEEELAKGDTELAKGDYEKAADKYKKAFEEARDSL